jgi:hypothetical protein
MNPGHQPISLRNGGASSPAIAGYFFGINSRKAARALALTV